MFARKQCFFGRISSQEHVFLILAVFSSALLSLNAQSTVTLLESNSSSIPSSPQPMSTNVSSICGLCRMDEYCDNATLECRRCMKAISRCTRCSTVMTSVKCFTCDSGQSLHLDGSGCGEDSQTMYIIIGCAIGGFVLIAVLVIVITCCVLKHRRPRRGGKKQPQPPPTKADLEQQYPTTYENMVIQSAPTTDELNQGQDITRYSRDPTVVKKEKRQSAFMQKFKRKSKHSEAAATVATSSHQQHPRDQAAADIEEQNYDNDVTDDGLPDESCYDNHDVLNSSNPPLPLPVTSHSSDDSSSDDDEEDGKPKKPDYVNVNKLGVDYENVPDVKKSAPHANKTPDYVNENVIAELARGKVSAVDYLPMDGPGPVASVGGALADDRRRGARVGNSGREAPRRGNNAGDSAVPSKLAQSELALNFGASGQQQAMRQLRRPSQQQASRY